MQQTIERIDRLMAPMLNDEQASELHTVLVACLTEKGGNPRGPETMTECIDLFLAAKKLGSARKVAHFGSWPSMAR